MPAAPVANVELRLLSAKKPKGAVDPRVAEHGGHAVKAHGHVRFLDLDPNAMPMTAPRKNPIRIDLDAVAGVLKDVRQDRSRCTLPEQFFCRLPVVPAPSCLDGYCLGSDGW